MTDKISDLHVMEATKCFPLYYYKKKEGQQGNLLGNDTAYEKKYAITDWILSNIRGRFGNARNITEQPIFY